MSAPTQKALLLTAKHGGEFVLGTTSIPKITPGHLLVKIHSTALNPVDWKIQKFGVIAEEYPAVLGVDAAGDVVEVGEGVTNFAKGDRVMFQGNFKNESDTFQEYALIAARTTAKIPAKFSYEEASTIPLAFCTSWVGLFQQAPLGIGLVPPTDPSTLGKYANTPLVILGGASSVGQYTIQIAKISGFSPIITTASLKHTEYLKSLGATHVIDRKTTTSTLSSEISKVISTPIKYVYDAISSDNTQQMGYDILSSGGYITITMPPLIKGISDDKTISQTGAFLLWPANVDFLPEMYRVLPEFMEEGLVKPNKVELIPGGFAGAIEGLVRMENDQVSGVKLVIHPQETA